MLRFIQTGDWHLGQAYRKFDGDLAERLRASRLEAIVRILAEAERSRATFVAVTGDQFDGPQPDPGLVRGMLERIATAKVAVHMIPGNHDPCGPGSVYERADFKARPSNLHLHEQPRSVRLPEAGATLFPCPCSSRYGDDPMAWIPSRGSDDGWRIALAHGSLPVAGGPGAPNFPIAGDAPRRFDLDYVALGDWHTPTPDPTTSVTGRMYYAGAPEVGGWDETGAGYALEVVLEPGSEPRVRPLRVGRHEWSELKPQVFSPLDVGRLLAELDGLASPDRVVRVRPAGALPIAERAALAAAVDARKSRFTALLYDPIDLRPLADEDADLPYDPVIREVHRRLVRLARDPTDGLPATFPKDLPRPDAEVIARALDRFRGLLH
ncbi:MAG: DNA repair exonuclease [Planctomycetaceae bacterium]|nr:DNA repair exonuclease [Planctomycetaceae bacterium]